jgi:signal transduction histidine kinase
MRSLRTSVFIGAALWTVGLLAIWAVAITLQAAALHSIVVIHAYPHALGMVAIVSMIVGFLLVRSGLQPFDELRRRLAAVQTGTARQVDGTYPPEVQPLVRDLNALLDHRDRAVGRALAKAGDLAHGLKTPLAVLAQEAERATATGQPQLAAAIAEQVERMRRQIDYHLAHARAAASGAIPGAHCDVRVSAEGLARTLQRLHAERGIAIDVQMAAGQAVRCQREDLDEMLGNLLDNACKWARTRVAIDARTRVAIDAGTIAGPADSLPVIEITVDDDGAGLAPELRAAVLQRGVRADEAAPGSGIGLAIVRELAELHGGSIVLDASPVGGLRAILRLPAAA